MRLDDLGLVADENIHPEVVEALRRQGFDVLDVKASGWIGSTDLEILRRACAENRVVLTHDSDFGKLAVTTREPTRTTTLNNFPTVWTVRIYLLTRDASGR